MSRLDEVPQIAVDSRAEWRAWLEANAAQSGSIWLVTWKKAAAGMRGLPFVGYDALVEEALCFGWIDSLPRALDLERTMLLFSPHKRGSSWSRVNRVRIARLQEANLMNARGSAVVEQAVEDGSWSRLEAVDDLTLPRDLADALAGNAVAAGFFARFPASSRRAILEWITIARTPQTRARRVALTVERAGENRKANFPAGRDRGPEL